MDGVYLLEMSTYPLIGSVHLLEVSSCGRCLLDGVVYLLDMSTYLLIGSVHLWEVSAVWEVSALGLACTCRRCQLVSKFCFIKKCLPFSSGCWTAVSPQKPLNFTLRQVN